VRERRGRYTAYCLKVAGDCPAEPVLGARAPRWTAGRRPDRAREIVFCHDGRVLARHERLQGRFEVSAQLDHYLELLAVKPGALARSLALRQERERGRWPDCFDQLWHGIAERIGASEAARQRADVHLLFRE